jgi:hypothetical protein
VRLQRFDGEAIGSAGGRFDFNQRRDSAAVATKIVGKKRRKFRFGRGAGEPEQHNRKRK